MGLTVQGSDMSESDTVRHLRSLGIDVAIGHSAENLKDCDLVIRTAAIHDENPEISGPSHGASPYMSGRRLGRHHAEIRKCRVLFRYPRQDHHHLHGNPYLHGGRGRPHGDDRRYAAPPHSGYRVGQGGHHHSGVLRVLQLLPELLPHGGGDP